MPVILQLCCIQVFRLKAVGCDQVFRLKTEGCLAPYNPYYLQPSTFSLFFSHFTLHPSTFSLLTALPYFSAFGKSLAITIIRIRVTAPSTA